MVADEALPPELRGLAKTLLDAYSFPISSHVVDVDLALRSSFAGNRMFEGDSYLAFLEAALEAIAGD